MHQGIHSIAPRQQTPFHNTEPQWVHALRHEGTPGRSRYVEEWRIPTNPTDNFPRFRSSCAHAGVSDEELHGRLEHEVEHPLTAFSTEEKSDAIGVYDWHWRMGHRSVMLSTWQIAR